VTTGPSLSSFLVKPAWPALRVHGPDAASWLNGIVTSNVLSVRPDRAGWGSLLTKQGKIQADLQITGGPTELVVFVSGGDTGETLATLDGYLVMEDAEIERSDAQPLVVFGSEAKSAVEAGGHQLAELGWGGANLWIASLSPSAWTGVAEDARTSRLLIDEESFGKFLIQIGVPRFGIDYSSADNPHAASLERRTVDWSKGCYLGQEVVCMQDMRGKVKRRLVRVRGPRGTALGSSVDVSHGDEVVGHVTSSAGDFALASVKAPHFEPGTVLRVGSVDVTVEPLL
jgi:folate-binding protein YgfZ